MDLVVSMHGLHVSIVDGRILKVLRKAVCNDVIFIPSLVAISSRACITLMSVFESRDKQTNATG